METLLIHSPYSGNKDETTPGSQKTFDQEINYGCQKHNDGQAIYAMHHFEIDVGWAIFAPPSEKIIADLSQGKKIFQGQLLFRLLLIFHYANASCVCLISIQLLSSLINSIN
jgi:hypothetical protein